MIGPRSQATRLRERLDELRSAPAFRNYENAREHVLVMLESAAAAAGGGSASEYWAEELENIDYMLDASPLIVERLRHHAYHITGIWPYNYRSHRERQRAQHETKLAALLEVGDASLFVPEASALGGFGFDLEPGLVNIDTLKYFEVMIALDRAEVLNHFRNGSGRRTVWEIGAGWGGFPYVFKTLFPDTTYVISDLPQLFLYSATYLATLFPEARFTFHPGDGTSLTDEEWAQSDFVFVPAHAVGAVTPPRVDLALNMVSFQEMSTEQVERYVEHAHELGLLFLYSLNRERSLYNPDLRGVTAIMGERYWLHEVEILSVTYGNLPDVIPRISRDHRKRLQQGETPAPVDERAYRHIIGRRRINTR